MPVFLFDIYGKGQTANLSKADRNALADALPLIGPAYRASIERAAKAMTREEELK